MDTQRDAVMELAPLRSIMSRNVVCVRPECETFEVVTLMLRHHVGCIPVVDERRRPLGMITKFDLVEQLGLSMQALGTGSPLPSDLSPRTADELMMPLALVLDEHASIARAAEMMTAEDTHHILIVGAERELVGVVSSKDIVAWLVKPRVH